MSCIARRWWKNWTELSLGWNLLNVNLKNLNFSVTLFPTFPSRGGGGVQKTQTETTEDPDWNNRRPYLKQHFIFSHFDQLLSPGSLGQSSEVKCNPKMSISLFDDLGGLLSHFGQLLFLGLLSQSSEVEHNPKTSISSYEDLGAFFHISVDFCHSDRSADHQKLNIIQKWAFHFLGWRGVADGVQVHRPARPIIRSWT